MSSDINDLLEANRRWARSVEALRPGFFTSLVNQQEPQYLWIGCSDSRVPANEIVGLASGELFVHRNVANAVVHSDLNCLSVIQFALERLKVRHIMVVGHYHCSGVRAALRGLRVGLSDNWLRHVMDVRNRHATLLDNLSDPDQAHNALCELNAFEQAVNVCNTTVVQDAWERGQDLTVHGMVYALHNGLIQELRMSVGASGELQNAYGEAMEKLYLKYSHADNDTATPATI